MRETRFTWGPISGKRSWSPAPKRSDRHPKPRTDPSAASSQHSPSSPTSKTRTPAPAFSTTQETKKQNPQTLDSAQTRQKNHRQDPLEQPKGSKTKIREQRRQRSASKEKAKKTLELVMVPRDRDWKPLNALLVLSNNFVRLSLIFEASWWPEKRGREDLLIWHVSFFDWFRSFSVLEHG